MSSSTVIRATDEISRRLATVRGAHILVTGGRSVGAVYRALTAHSEVDWRSFHYWFSDERCVPLGDPLSNFGSVSESFLNPLNIPVSHIHRIQGERGKNEAAACYDAELHDVFASLPVFDLAILSMGDDGHIASLFPNRTYPQALDTWAFAVDAPSHIEPHIDRVSLTFPVLNNARRILLLLKGDAKIKLYETDASIPARQLNPSITETLHLRDDHGI